MSNRYKQSCALARTAEVLGERWTLLIIRELLLGPKRFTDLKARLGSVSASVLTERLARLEELGVVGRGFLPAPAASAVYELTASGRDLQTAVHALVRWGARYLLPLRPDEPMEPDWLRMVLAAYASKAPSPPLRYEIRVREGDSEAVIHVAGGEHGTAVTDADAPSDLRLAMKGEDLLALMAGRIRPADAVRDGRIEAEGDLSALDVFSELFDAAVSDGGVHVKG
jgi:DNA-binding HxlR family transcriptional regulator